MERLKGRVALITGAGAGIGREIALTFARNGASIAVVDINQEAAAAVAGEVGSTGARAIAVKCDVANPEEVRAAVNATVHAFGELHILVNNAGICPLRSFEDISIDEWNTVLAINLTGPFLLAQAALPYLKKAGSKGRVINMGSLAGQIGGIAVGAHYSVSKAGIIVLAKQMAKLLAPYRATANSISPGTTDTPLTQAWPEDTREGLVKQIPLGRLGEPRDIADLALFLASDEAAFITGATINVNGGLFIG